MNPPENDDDTGYRLLVSLVRVANEWVAVETLQTELTVSVTCATELAVCDSRVLLGETDQKTLYGFDVSAEHHMRAVGSLEVRNAFYRMTSTRLDAERLVAFSHRTAVSVHRLVEPFQLESLTHVELSSPYHLLFWGNLLLVADKNLQARQDAIVSFLATGTSLTRQHQLLDSNANIAVAQWCIAGDQLVVWDRASKDLLLYAFD